MLDLPPLGFSIPALVLLGRVSQRARVVEVSKFAKECGKTFLLGRPVDLFTTK